MSEELRSMVQDLSDELQKRTVSASRAYWQMATTGGADETTAAAAAEKELRLFLSDQKTFQALKTARSQSTGDPLLDRQVDLLYRAYLENQLAPEIIEQMVTMSTELEQIFATFRGEMDGRAVTDGEIRTILQTSRKNSEREEAWRASKQIGREVAPRLLELVKVRNEAAQQLGFRNYYEMQLELSEIKRSDLFGLMADIKELTEKPFTDMKRQLDEEIAANLKTHPSELRPWHYADPFFQELPSIGGGIDLDSVFADKSVEDLAVQTYDSIGMDVRPILSKSDLYERPGKNQHAFCTDIDREGDVRVLANLKPDAYSMNTLLHELGHGVYSRYVDPSLPWLLREEAHISSTEGVAMYFERLVRDAHWLNTIAGVPEAEAKRLAQALKEEQARAVLILVRWILVMVEFESRLYEHPDQDLNRLWWNLVRSIQQLNQPENLTGYEWATKIHLTIAPVYYHNYLIGEVTASHLGAHIARATGTTHVAGNPAAGQWLRERFFKPGARCPWNRLLEEATGEPLNPRHFVSEVVR